MRAHRRPRESSEPGERRRRGLRGLWLESHHQPGLPAQRRRYGDAGLALVGDSRPVRDHRGHRYPWVESEVSAMVRPPPTWRTKICMRLSSPAAYAIRLPSGERGFNLEARIARNLHRLADAERGIAAGET